ncbi:UNVERIFIED_CONTAM: rhoptry kinase family protein ROP22 (incomplete catalytic triad) [Hammondia hammondi]|eukprot:XP_008886919.1 rhoptry kinase family protein ROP22 (incomplete catalytic triad) [Hammondia hammondi]
MNLFLLNKPSLRLPRIFTVSLCAILFWGRAAFLLFFAEFGLATKNLHDAGASSWDTDRRHTASTFNSNRGNADRSFVQRAQAVSDKSVAYWKGRIVEDGDVEVEDKIVNVAQEIVGGGDSLSAVDPTELRDVARILAATERPKVVANADAFKEKRFAIFSAGLRTPTSGPKANTFRFLAPDRIEKFAFPGRRSVDPQAVSRQSVPPANFVTRGSGETVNLKGIELTAAARGLFVTKVSAVVRQEADGSSPKNPLSNSLQTCSTQRRLSYQMLDGFVAEVDKVYEEEVEARLAWELRIWRHLPSSRAEHLAAEEHILIPGALLSHSGRGAPSSRRKDAAHFSRESDGKWNDLLSEKVFNVFIWYPAGYRDTLESSMMHSDQITEPWFSSTPRDVMESITVQMILAVANLNSYGLVHTHLRSSSFVFTPEGIVLLSDLNRVVRQGEFMDCVADREASLNDLTASPEERVCVHEHGYKGRDAKKNEELVGPLEAHPTVDAWRLAVILYKLWCLESMYERSSYHQFVARQDLRRIPDSESNITFLRQNPFPMNACRKDMPSSLQRLLRQMLESDPANRITSAEAVKNSSFFHDKKRAVLRKKQERLIQKSHPAGG